MYLKCNIDILKCVSYKGFFLKYILTMLLHFFSWIFFFHVRWQQKGLRPVISSVHQSRFNPNLPGPVNFVPFGTMRNSRFDINLISITYIKFVYLYFSLFLNKAQTFLFAMINDLPRYIIILTFIIVIDSRLTLDIFKMGWVNQG